MAQTLWAPLVLTKLTYQQHEGDVPIEQHLRIAFEGSAARSNYLSADRVDCQYACKEICRSMSAPTEASWKALRRLGRYPCCLPRLVYTYRRQEIDAIDVYVDTDGAVCAYSQVHVWRCGDARQARHQSLGLGATQRITKQW